MRPRVRIIAADSHPIFLAGLTRGIRDERPDLELVGMARDGRAALREIRELRPAVALIAPDLPSLTGMRILTAVTREALPTRVLFLSAAADSEAVYDAIEVGAAGWLTKDADCHEIGDAVIAAHRGETVLSPALHAGLADEIATRGGAEPPPLTARERQVLTLIADGNTVNRVGRALGMSRATVKTHLQHLYDKLGVSSQAAAVAEAMRRGLMQ